MEKETFHTINFLMDLFRAKDQLQNSNSSPNSSSSADIELSALTGLARTLLGQTTLSKSTINANSNGGHGISIGSNNSDDSRTDLVVKFLTALRSVCSTSHEFSLNASPISGDDLTRDYEIESRTEEMLEVIALKEDEKEKVGGENVVTTPKSPRFMIPPSSPSSVIKSPLLQNTPLLVGGRKTNGDELDKLLLDSK